jgi:electron transport complex protein RnfD
MRNQKKFIVSHAPFWHNGSSITERSAHTLLATLPALAAGLILYGMPALGVVAIGVSSAILWELLLNRITRRAVTIGDGNAAVIGLLLAMLLPATTPWWAVITGTFVAIVVGKQIFGGIGGNVFNPVLVALAILMLSWKHLFDFDTALVHYDMSFPMAFPLAALKNFGVAATETYQVGDLLLGRQAGAIGSTFGPGLILGGVYLMARGFIRWEISLSFLAGIVITSLVFNAADPARFAGPFFHLFTGYTLMGAFFLVTEDSSSPVNFLPMILYGGIAGIMTILIRNIGAYADGVVFAVLIANLANPLLDKIRPTALGKVI